MEKSSFSFSLGSVMQVAFVVDDIERELDHWTRTLGIGPFFYLPHFPLIGAQYRGSPMTLDIAVALAFNGTTCYELIRQNSDGPSPFQQTPTKRSYGFHHWAIPTRTFDAELAERQRSGMTLVASATVGLGGRVAYLETASQLGGLLEILEFTPEVEGVFSMIHAASQSWDGTDPVRQLGPPR